MAQCPACGKDVLDIDVKCPNCGEALGATGAQRMIGTTMLGMYELVDVLGQGGMSVVFKGRHKITDQDVALKILPPELAAHSQVKSRFLDEAKALAALDHPNIVHLYNFGAEDGYFVLAMQYVHGRTWERLILENKRLDWAPSCKIAIDVLRALEYAHGRGVVHRDMKPSNVLVRSDDGNATVMDFGIAKSTTSTRLTATGQTMGTVRYMSPEQVRGQEVDLRTDIYSLGATLYESLVGDTPFDGNTHFEIMSKHLNEPAKRPSTLGVVVPREIEDALMRSLAKRATDRFDSARDLRKVLENVMREHDIALVETQKLGRELLGDLKTTTKERRPQQPQRVATAADLADELEPSATGRPRTKRRRRWPWAVLAALVIGGGATAGVLVLRERQGRPHGPFGALTLEAPKTVGELTVVTDGTTPADGVARTYRNELLGLQDRINTALAKEKKGPVELPDKIHDIYALPQSALCMRSAYVDRLKPPDNCGELPFVITIDRDQRPKLYVVSTRLDEGVRGGVAEAACMFQPDEGELSRRICKLATGEK
jgi:serine/threonine protein kinase